MESIFVNKRSLILGSMAQIGASVLFGLAFLAVKVSVSSVSPLTLLAWRFTLAFAVMSLLSLFKVIKIDLRKKDIRPLLVIAAFQPVAYFAAETFGIQLTTASESSTVLACIPIVTIILSSIFLKEKPTRLQVLSIVVCVVGVILIGLVKGQQASFSLLGYALLFCAAISDGVFVVLSRRARAYSSAEKTYVMMGLGALFYTAAAFIEHGANGTVTEFLTLPFVDMSFLSGLMYLALACSIAGFMLANYGISAIGAARSSSFAGLSTVISVLAGVIILGEDFSLMQGIGTVLVLLGVYGANIIPKNAVAVDTHPGETVPDSDKSGGDE